MRNIFGILCFIISKVKIQLKHKRKICAVCREGAVMGGMCQKWIAKFLDTMVILAKWFFAVGLSYALEDV